MSPSVAAPALTRDAPTSTSSTLAYDGTASRKRSNVARSRARRTFDARSDEARSCSRPTSRSSAPKALMTVTASRLSWTSADTSPSRSCASLAGRPPLRWKITFCSTSTGNRASASRPRTASVAIIQIVDVTIRMTVPSEYGMGASTSVAASASTPAWAMSSPVGWARCQR